MKPRRQNSLQPLPQPPKKKWFGNLVITLMAIPVLYGIIAFNTREEEKGLESQTTPVVVSKPDEEITSENGWQLEPKPKPVVASKPDQEITSENEWQLETKPKPVVASKPEPKLSTDQRFTMAMEEYRIEVAKRVKDKGAAVWHPRLMQIESSADLNMAQKHFVSSACLTSNSEEAQKLRESILKKHNLLPLEDSFYSLYVASQVQNWVKARTQIESIVNNYDDLEITETDLNTLILNAKDKISKDWEATLPADNTRWITKAAVFYGRPDTYKGVNYYTVIVPFTTVQPSQSMGVMYFKLVFNKEHAALERGSWAINDIGPARGVTSRGRGTITAIELLKDVVESYE